MMFPYIQADLKVIENIISDKNAIKPLGKCFIFDFVTGEHKIVDGKLVEGDFIDGITQWIEKILRTELGKYKIYTLEENEGFGISIFKYMGFKNFPIGFISSELKREITEQLISHRFIEEVIDYGFFREKRGFKVVFSVVLKNGSFIQKELIIDGV